MNAVKLLTELRAAGIRVEPRPAGTLRLTPKDRLTPELIEQVRAAKAEILAMLTKPSPADNRARWPCDTVPDSRGPLIPPDVGTKIDAVEVPESEPCTPPLELIANAIASAQRSPFLDDLAIARAARAYVEVERAIRDAPPVLRVEVTTIATDTMTRVAVAVRGKQYQSAYQLLDSLTTKMRELRMH